MIPSGDLTKLDKTQLVDILYRVQNQEEFMQAEYKRRVSKEVAFSWGAVAVLLGTIFGYALGKRKRI